MIDRTQIRQHMDVIASDGERIGTVDEIDGERIKLTKSSSSDGQHHHINLSDVARVDEHVHLTKTRGALGLAAAAVGGTASAADARAIPPRRDTVAKGGDVRGIPMLWWVVGGLALLTLILALATCGKDDGDRNRAADSATPAIVTPRVAGAPLTPGTLAYDLDRFMGSKDGLPRTFAFDVVNFASGTANLRNAEGNDLDDIARVLAAYPSSRAAVVGYADALGDSAFNRDLGANRAKAVIAALAARGVPADRIEARTGGESNSAATNVTPGGRFENRRTELVILKR